MDKCQDLAKNLAKEKEEIKAQMADFLFCVIFLDDFGVPRRENLVSKEAQHVMNNMFNT